MGSGIVSSMHTGYAAAARQKVHDFQRLESQRNDLSDRVRSLKEESPGSYVGEVVKVMGESTVLVKVHPELEYVDIYKTIDITKITPPTRVAEQKDSYVLHLVLPCKVDSLLNLIEVEKVPHLLMT